MRPLKAIRGGLARRPQQLSRSWPLRRPFSDHNGVAGRRWSTPLAKTLAEAVTALGPLPLASYMRACLTSPTTGYYTSRADKSVGSLIGAGGDFITSPEISQIFGELVGVWHVAEWLAQGARAAGVQLIELGPGRGTLMSDVLRLTARRQIITVTKRMAGSIEGVYLVEKSEVLRDAQHRLLCGDEPMVRTESGWRSRSSQLKHLDIVWCEDLRDVPQTRSSIPFITAHEFFDALPIHAFQAVEDGGAARAGTEEQSDGGGSRARPLSQVQNQWRELVVTVNPTPTPTPTPTPALAQAQAQAPAPVPAPAPAPADFQLSLAKQATRHSQLLPGLSPRYAALQQHAGAAIEVSPDSLALAGAISQRIGDAADGRPAAGAALLVDYGPADRVPTDSLRGVYRHERVSPFHLPGATDLSADVDFAGLAAAALEANEYVAVHGPVSQAGWLVGMGGRQRLERLAGGSSGDSGHGGDSNGPADGAERARRIAGGWQRLTDVGPDGMGRLYKVMAILPDQPTTAGLTTVQGPVRIPAGFQSDIVRL